MRKHVKLLSLFVLLFTLSFTLGNALQTTGLLSQARTYVIPLSPPPPSAKDSIQMGTFNFITVTPSPTPAPTNPPGGGGTGGTGGQGSVPAASGKAVWPFPQKSPAQYRRIDQGWDLQYHQKTTVHAVVPGTVRTGNNPGGFGPSYPIVSLDAPVCGYKEMYYGHVTAEPSVIGKHVNAGQVIAHTEPTGKYSVGLPNWLEMGFRPMAQSIPSPEGYQMRNWLSKNSCSKSP